MDTTDPPFELRPAAKGDARGLAELWADAFPGERAVDVRLRHLLEGEGPYGGLETCWVAKEGDRLLGAFRHYELRMHLWGRAFATQGLASVAVAPDARRRGLGRWLCHSALRLARERGAVLSALFPFRTDFYAKAGYVLTGEMHRYRIPAASLPVFPEHENVRRLRDSEREARVPDFYASLLPRTHGLIERSPEMWLHRFSEDDSTYGFLDDEGTLRGYVVVNGRGSSDPDRAVLRVRELLADDAASYRGLLGWLSTQRDQWRNLRYDALPGENFHRLLSHPRLRGTRAARGLWFPSATLLRGPMLRIIDLPALLEAVEFGPGAFLQVRDEELPENSGTWVGDAEGPRRDTRQATGDGGLPIGLVTELFVDGGLPGQEETVRQWTPTLGVRDFRLLDIF